MKGEKIAKISGENAASRLVSSGMDRLLQDQSASSYRFAFRVMFLLVTIMSLVMVVLTGTLAHTIKKGRKGDRYFAMHFDGKTKRLIALNTPSLNQDSMLSWAAAAATDVLTFDFSDVDKRLYQNRKYFTEIGYQSFIAAVKRSRLFSLVRKNQQILTAIPTRMPNIAYQGFRNGIYVWDVHVPVLLTIRAGDVRRTASPTLIVTIVQVPTKQDPSGWGIGQWTMF